MKRFARILNSEELNYINTNGTIPANFGKWNKKTSGESINILEVNGVSVEVNGYNYYKKGEVVFLFDLRETSPSTIRGLINNRIISEDIYAVVFSADLNVHIDESNEGWLGSVVHNGEIRFEHISTYEVIKIEKSSVEYIINHIFDLPD